MSSGWHDQADMPTVDKSDLSDKLTAFLGESGGRLTRWYRYKFRNQPREEAEKNADDVVANAVLKFLERRTFDLPVGIWSAYLSRYAKDAYYDLIQDLRNHGMTGVPRETNDQRRARELDGKRRLGPTYDDQDIVAAEIHTDGAYDRDEVFAEYLRRESERALKVNVGKLSSNQRQILEAMLGPPYRTLPEAARYLRMPLNTVKTHYSRAKARMRKMMRRD